MRKGQKASAETRERMASAKRGRKHAPDCFHCSPETRAKIGAAHRGKTHSAETRAKISAAKMGQGHTAETRTRIAATMREHVRSPEHRASISASKMGDRNPAKRLEVREKIRATLSTEKKRAEARAYRMAQRHPTSGTQPEQIMAALLLDAGVMFEGQKPIGPYVVDFYLPASHAVIEVDGTYWHRTPKPERDAFLLSNGVSMVHHVTDAGMAQRGWL